MHDRLAAIHRNLVAAILAVTFAFATQRAGAAAPVLAPSEHSDFTYYTFALTWQPGICSTEDGCLADQPKSALIGLHGLWASLPATLTAQGVTSQQWWQRGCDFFQHSDAAPALDAPLERRLDDVMPHFTHPLLTHEYDKHVQCFGFDAERFFATALAMRDAVAGGAFGAYLVQHAGRDVTHAELSAAFDTDFATTATTSLQLQCGHDATGRTVLTQLWVSIDATKLADFPQADSLIDAPIAQDNCPSTFRLPAWPAP
jgi:ribonuclease I